MPTLLQVFGLGRSGTTMLDLMLGNTPQAFSCGEVYAWFRPWRTHHANIVCSCGEEPCPLWERIKDADEQDFHAAACRELEVGFLVDSSKEECWVIDSQPWAARHGLDVFNLLLWKEPTDSLYSYFKRDRTYTFWRQRFVGYYRHIFSAGVPFYAIHFNDLAADPATVLKQICLAIGMPYRDGQERFWEGDHHHLFGSRGTRLQREGKGDLGLREKTEFSPEFLAQLPAFSERIDADEGLQEIVRRLRAAAIGQAPAVTPHVANVPAVMPPWYYVKKLKAAVRRRFPQKWHLRQ